MEQPIVVDLASVGDRTCVMLVLRSAEPIGMQALIGAIVDYAGMLKEKFPPSKIEVPKTIILPDEV